MTNERRTDEDIPEHERRTDSSVGGGMTSQGGTTPETDEERRPAERGEGYTLPGAGQDRPAGDPDDDEPADPNGPEVAFTPRSV